MEGNLGVILSEKKDDYSLERNSGSAKKSTSTGLSVGLLAAMLILTFIYTLKQFSPAENVIIISSILFYPFTFLIIASNVDKYGFKIARKNIFTAALIFILFILFIMLASLISANVNTQGYDSIVQYIFASNVGYIGNFRFFYPPLGQFFGVLLAFVASHLLFATIYNALKKFTMRYLSFGLAIFIGAIVDRLIYMPILFLENLIKGSNTFDYFIKCLTSEFISTIFASILMIILFVIISLFKKPAKN